MQKDEDGFYIGVPASAPPAEPSTSASPVAVNDAEEDESTGLIKSAFEVKVTLADQQADPNSPLYSVKSFEELGLHEDLRKGLLSMNFSKPSKIQERALPLLLSDPPTNMIGQSQSGTGKTAAFVLTMLSRCDFNKDVPQAICLAPSRELARQIMSVVVSMGQYTKVKTEYAIRDSVSRNVTKINAHIVVGTPGTMITLLRKRVINVDEVKVLVLDEADNMLDNEGLGDQTIRVRNFFKNRQDPQIVLFSATFPDHVRKFAEKFAPNANQIALQKTELNVPNITQFYLDCKDKETKFDVLTQLYTVLTIGQSIIFCQSRITADRIADKMITQGHKVASLHGAKDAVDRDQIIDRFREGREKVLITTNVIARGIDVLQVNMVVNYDIPLMNEREKYRQEEKDRVDAETYIHRIGRTGRFGRKGMAVNFVHDKRTWDQILELESALGVKIERIETSDIETMENAMRKALKAS